MKEIKKMVLKQIANKELSKRQMGKYKGGKFDCICGCCYQNTGGSNTVDNGLTNCDLHLKTYCPYKEGWILC